jgi:putative methionine-R-sulfoxide reductase with GAF domain
VIAFNYKDAEDAIKTLLSSNASTHVLQDVVDLLYEGFEQYSWVGIYVVRGKNLILGPWRGNAATEHTTIPIGTGVCGAAASTGKTELVEDVSKDRRYLACFLSTRSEIVVPIKKKNIVVGEIDIDSDTPAAFDTNDKMFLEKVADMLRPHI